MLMSTGFPVSVGPGIVAELRGISQLLFGNSRAKAT